MSAPDVALEACDLHARYRRAHVLRGANLVARAGELVAILGENGAGKSTLLRILAGVRAPDSGTVRARGAIGYCPQESALSPYLTPDEHLALFARALGLGADEARRRADALLEAFRFTKDRGRIVEELSGGTRQKLNLAIALLADPPVLLLDEPYSGFDVETYRCFVAHTDDARRRGRCVVVVTHIAFEPGWFDTVLHLRDGAIHDGAR